jgi:hypothetical protein
MSLNILLTGGIGDWLTIESHMTDEQRSSLDSIFYATRAQKAIKELIDSCPTFSVKNHIIVWDDFSRIFAFHNKREVISAASGRQNRGNNRGGIVRWHELMKNVEDYSISKIFNEIPNIRSFSGSSFLRNKIANVDKFIIPGHKDWNYNVAENYSPKNNFFVIAPYSPNDRRNPLRDFNNKDWLYTLKFLESHQIFGVVLNIGNDKIPDHPLIVNLSNKTSFQESIEIIKKAIGYIGIDSSLSVLAAQLFDIPNLIIKSNNNHCYCQKHVYYAPRRKFKFIVRRLG